MSISLEQLSAQMRRGEQVPLRHTMQVVLTPVSYTHLTLPTT